jgi:hypothetical protein
MLLALLIRRAAPATCLTVTCALLLLSGSAAADSPDVVLTRRIFLPALYRPAAAPTSVNQYEVIPVPPPRTDRPAAEHGDLNLALRGFSATSAELRFIDYEGSTDGNAPQLPGVFADRRTPSFVSVHRVNDWNWSCGGAGCRAKPLSSPAVTLLGLGTRAGEPLAAPSRGPEIYGGGYKTLVLYADETRITLKYTREDSVVSGYTVHLEGLTVDPNLLSRYRAANSAGRGSLPALRDGQPLGAASGSQVLVAVRDCGTFLDPRSRKDWWQGR